MQLFDTVLAQGLVAPCPPQIHPEPAADSLRQAVAHGNGRQDAADDSFESAERREAPPPAREAQAKFIFAVNAE